MREKKNKEEREQGEKKSKKLNKTTTKQRNKKGEGKSPRQLLHERSNYQEPSL